MGFLEIVLLIGTMVGSSTETAEVAVLSNVEAFAEAFQNGDVETIEGLLGSTYSHCNSSGSRPSREQWLEWYGSRAEEIREGRFTYTEYEIEDIRIQFHGEVAVVTMVNTYKASNNGESVSGRLLLTQVWAIEDGEWKRIAFHDSRIPGGA